MRVRRYVLGTALLAVGAFAGALAYGALSNLWADYQESPTSTYLVIGLPALAFMVAAFIAGVAVLRGKA